MNGRYQLIKPIMSDKLYDATSLMKGAKKCYNEVKQSRIENAETFTIRNIDTKEIYTFKIHHPYVAPLKLSGGNDQSQIVLPDGGVKMNTNNTNVNNDRMITLEKKVEIVESKIDVLNKSLEQKIGAVNNVITEQNVKLTKYMEDNSGCVIL